jgi:hypothetical protein
MVQHKYKQVTTGSFTEQLTTSFNNHSWRKCNGCPEIQSVSMHFNNLWAKESSLSAIGVPPIASAGFCDRLRPLLDFRSEIDR